MRVALAFPPLASPSYVPLGLATLAPGIRRGAPGCALTLHDLNLEAWHARCAADDDGRTLVALMQGRAPGFWDPARYVAAQATWGRIQAALRELCGATARRFLEDEGARPAPEPALAALLDPLVARLLADDPELVGLSVVFPEQLLPALALARRLRQAAAGGRREVPRVVLGGAALAAVAAVELVRRRREVDAALVGEGEPGVALLCAGAEWTAVPGLVWRGADGGVRRNRRAPAVDLAALPPPDFAGLPLDRVLSPAPVLPLLYSRGCRWRRCRFCAHNHSFGAHRARRPAAFAAEVDELARRHGARHVYLADQYVAAADLEALTLALAERGTDVALHAMARPTADHTPERLARCVVGGLRWVSWGVESGAQRLLDLVDKGTEVAAVARVIHDARAAGLSNLVMMIFGLPTSTDADLEQTLRLLEDLHPATDALTPSSFVLFAGTHFARHAARYGLVVTGAEELVGRGTFAVRSHRLRYHELGADGTPRPPRGPLEVAAWERRQAWLGELPFVNRLPAEHYLLHAAR